MRRWRRGGTGRGCRWSWEQSGLYVESYAARFKRALAALVPEASKYEGILKQIKDALSAELTAMDERERLVGKRLAEDKQLADSALRLAKARLDAAVADGSLDKETADAKKAELESSAAEADYDRESQAARERAAIRQQAAQAAQAAAEQADEVARKAKAEFESLASAPSVKKADMVDPGLRKRERDARSARGMAIPEARPVGIYERAERMADAANEVPKWQQAIPNYGAIKMIVKAVQSWQDTTAAVESGAEMLAQAEAELKAAVEARAVAVEQELQKRNQAAEEARRAAEQAKEEADRQARTAALAGEQAAGYQPGGVHHQIRDNDRQMRHPGLPPGAAPNPFSPDDFAGLSASPELDQFMEAVADGIERRELALLERLMSSIAFLDRDNPAVEAKLRQLEQRLNDLSTKL